MKGSEELTSGQKLVWMELADLDTSEQRAFVSAAHLAARLGMGMDNVEQARRVLKGYGLLASGPCPGKKLVTWWPILPRGCEPASPKPKEPEVRSLAQQLDDAIRSARAGPEEGAPGYANPPNKEGVPQSASRRGPEGVSQSATQQAAGGVVQYAGRGVGGRAPSSNELGTSSYPSLDMQRSQGGGNDRTRSRERGKPPPRGGPPSEFRTLLEQELGPRPADSDT